MRLAWLGGTSRSQRRDTAQQQWRYLAEHNGRSPARHVRYWRSGQIFRVISLIDGEIKIRYPIYNKDIIDLGKGKHFVKI